MGRYLVSRDNVTPTGGQDVLTIISGASRRVRIAQVSVNGRGSTSAAQQIEVSRSSGGSGAGGAITPDKGDHSDQPAANFTTATSWSASPDGQPTMLTNKEMIGFNALGGANRWIPPKGVILEARNGEMISIRATSGPTWQAMSLSVIVEED
jgi:hypothetical protein